MGKKKRRAERNQREQIQKMQDFTSGMVTDYKGQVADQQGAVDAAMSDYKDFDFTNPFADLTNPYAGIQTEFDNIYAGAENVYAGAENVYAGAENVAAGAQNMLRLMLEMFRLV